MLSAKERTANGLTYVDHGDYVVIHKGTRIYEEWVHYKWESRKLMRWFHHLGKRIDIK